MKITYNDKTSLVISPLPNENKVTDNDEWLCEAYMKTDYTTLSDDDFKRTVNDYLGFLVKGGELNES